MRVVFNALSSFRQRTGVGSYASHLASALSATAGHEVAIFPEGWMASAARFVGRAMSASPAGSSGSSLTLKSRVRRVIRNGAQGVCEYGFRRAFPQGRFDLYHEPNFIPWDCDLPTVATVHDLSVLLHPEWHPPDRVAHHEERFERALNCCRHVLTVSQAMRLELMAHCGLTPDRVTAIHNGVRPDLRPLNPTEAGPFLQRLGLRPGFLLYVGTVEPRKNVLTLLKAYCALDAELRALHPLVLVGPWGWGFEHERSFYESKARHRGVIHVGYVPDGDLAALYSSAAALVYPSRYEGFGLPPVEMMACGGAVLASTADAVREVCGAHAEFIDPDDEAGWRDAMERVVTDEDWRRELRRGVIQHARRFSWQRCAEETWATYKAILDGSRVPVAA